MLLGHVEKFKNHIETRYPYLSVNVWDDGRFLEDYKSAYVALVPLNQTEFGTARISQRVDTFDLFTRFWVVWKLPKVTDDIISAAIQETERLGLVRSVTWNTTMIYKRMGYALPPTKISFVAVEVELESQILINKNSCECLLQCSDYQDPDFSEPVRFFSSDEDALSGGLSNGERYCLTSDNIYGMPAGTNKTVSLSGDLCQDEVMRFYPSDTEAKLDGMLRGQTYFTSADNIYGIPMGIPKKIVE